MVLFCLAPSRDLPPFGWCYSLCSRSKSCVAAALLGCQRRRAASGAHIYIRLLIRGRLVLKRVACAPLCVWAESW